jgi:hypothetical protein
LAACKACTGVNMTASDGIWLGWRRRRLKKISAGVIGG